MIFRCPECNGLYDVIYPWSEVNSTESTVAGTSSAQPQRPPLALAGAPHLHHAHRPVRRLALPRPAAHRRLDSTASSPCARATPRSTSCRAARKAAGLDFLLAKHQGMNPTGSFKDTGMTAALSVAVERGFEWVACASTGNTSAAMAAYAARAGLRSIVFIPEGKIAWGKLSQSMDYGALTIQLKTDFDGCVDILTELVSRFPIYLLNSVNPYRLEGQKTPAIEILEQLDWQVPDHIVVPGGNLANSSALGKGFQEMQHLGLIPRVPKISVIQAEGANPLYRWFTDSNRDHEARQGRHPRHRHPHRQPRQLAQGRRASSRPWAAGASRSSEQEIALAKAEIGAEGVGCEPASAVTFAGLKKLVAAGQASAAKTASSSSSPATPSRTPQYTIDYHRGDLLTAAEQAEATPAQQPSTPPCASPQSSSKPTPTSSCALSRPT